MAKTKAKKRGTKKGSKRAQNAKKELPPSIKGSHVALSRARNDLTRVTAERDQLKRRLDAVRVGLKTK